ncbi:MAG: glycosyltransferase, partial [Frankia sp.]
RVLSSATHVLQPPPRPAVPIPEWVAALGPAGRPVAYVTFGSMFQPDSALLRAFAAAAGTVDVEFVASFGPDVATDQVSGLLPANVHVVAFMPREVEQALLDRADLVVCHGGYGALLNAMSRARPVLCIPQRNADDPTRLAQLRRLGSVVVLDEAHRGRDDIADALHALLTRTTYRQAARAVADELATQPGFDAAAGLIEELYHRHSADPRPAPSS